MPLSQKSGFKANLVSFFGKRANRGEQKKKKKKRRSSSKAQLRYGN